MAIRAEQRIPAGEVVLIGTLALPDDPIGLVLLVHGSGSSRLSPRNRHVAHALEERGLGTLLFDLLTTNEERVDQIDGRLRFDIPLLARRLVAVTDWVRSGPRTRDLPLGYFGASTGAAAALIAAAKRPAAVAAVVSRGGRPDLAGASLARVRAPTLLLVGGHDWQVIALNRAAAAEIRAPCRLAVIPGATHLFEEPGTLDEVAREAGEFFVDHLAPTRAARHRPGPPAPPH